ncbi:MAG: HAMP domain-containing protein [Oscillochloris sp.]|nr:HAMP domain-containing protein [Oscillochloris sp.]
MILYQNRSEALAPVNSAQSSTLITALLVMTLATIVATSSAELISRPIRRITVAAEQITGGDLAQHVEVHGNDEISRLAHSFNQMTTALKERISTEQEAQAERLHMQQALIEAQDHRIKELSAPTIPLHHNTLLLPLIGSVDQRRAEHVLEAILADVHIHRARTLILDISGVSEIDAQVITVLMQAAQGVRLLGAEVVLVGIRAQTARTLTDLNIDLTDITIYASLQEALNTMLHTKEPVANRH